MRILIAGIVVTAIAGIAAIGLYSLYDEMRHIEENRFTDTAIGKKERLHLSGGGNSYKILTKDDKILKYTSTEHEELKYLEIIIKPEMKADFTGYPDRKTTLKIHTEKIAPIYKTK